MHVSAGLKARFHFPFMIYTVPDINSVRYLDLRCSEYNDPDHRDRRRLILSPLSHLIRVHALCATPSQKLQLQGKECDDTVRLLLCYQEIELLRPLESSSNPLWLSSTHAVVAEVARPRLTAWRPAMRH